MAKKIPSGGFEAKGFEGDGPKPDGFKADLNDFEVRDIDLYSSIQQRLARVGEHFSTLAQALWGKDVANFLDSTPGHDQMGDDWRPARGLGKGGFGTVGLWQKVNNHGVVEDEIAIKETTPTPQIDVSLQRDPRLPREALVMKQLNDAEDARPWTAKNILRLRSFKLLLPARRRRFYLEFAPHGEFFKLIYLYKGWDQYLPEEFLWHVFHSLARAVVIMDEGPFTDPETQEEDDDLMVLHLDLKPENVYMAQPDKAAIFKNYPTVKLADFGISQFTSPADKRNPHDFRRTGTEDYWPPEQRHYTIGWDQRPDGYQINRKYGDLKYWQAMEAARRDPGYQFLSRYNIWGIGKHMHDMLTLDYPPGLDMKMDLTTEKDYYGKYEEFPIPPITTLRHPEYSSELRDLIRECLAVKIEYRPKPQQLLERTEAGLKRVKKACQREGGSSKGPRVYYMGHEINHMPAGKHGIDMRQEDLRVIASSYWPDPAWPALFMGRWAPEVITQQFVTRPIQKGGPRRMIPSLNANVRLYPYVPGGSQRGVKWEFVTLPADNEELLGSEVSGNEDDGDEDGDGVNDDNGDENGGGGGDAEGDGHEDGDQHPSQASKSLGKETAGLGTQRSRSRSIRESPPDEVEAKRSSGPDLVAQLLATLEDILPQAPRINRRRTKVPSKAAATEQQPEEQPEKLQQRDGQQRDEQQQQEQEPASVRHRPIRASLNSPKKPSRPASGQATSRSPHQQPRSQQSQIPTQTQTQPQPQPQQQEEEDQETAPAGNTRKRKRAAKPPATRPTRRIMGLDIDPANLPAEPEGTDAGGHNLRSRRRSKRARRD